MTLFNGKDLTGWGYKSGERFDGKAESDDKRFSAKDGVLIVHPGTGICPSPFRAGSWPMS